MKAIGGQRDKRGAKEFFMASCRFGRALSDVGRRKCVEVQISFWPHFEHVAGRLAKRNRLRRKEFQAASPA